MLDDTGMTFSAKADADLKDLRARVDAHNKAVKEAREGKDRDETAVKEYVARWDAYLGQVADAEKSAAATFGYVTEAEVENLKARLRILLIEWDTVGFKVQTSKGEVREKVLSEVLSDLKEKGSGLPATKMPTSQATPPPAPTPAPTPAAAPAASSQTSLVQYAPLAGGLVLVVGVLLALLRLFSRPRKRR